MSMLLRMLQLDVVSGGLERERCYALQVENISGVRLELLGLRSNDFSAGVGKASQLDIVGTVSYWVG